MIGHVASPFHKERASRRAYTVPSNVLIDEYPLETFDNMTLSEIKSRNYFKGMNSWEQGALGLILHTARDYQRMCNTSTQECLENQEHMTLTEQIRQIMEKNERETREVAKRTADEMREQLQKLTQFNEERLRCGPDRNQDFTSRIMGTSINPQSVFADKIGAAKSGPVRTSRATVRADAAGRAPNSYALGVAPSSYTTGFAAALATPDTPKAPPMPTTESPALNLG
jgi:hypothetical protein